MLGEGRWECKVDEKGRFLFPAKIRDKFGSKGTWAKEPSGWIVLYPAESWEQEVLAGVKDLQQFREIWEPFDVDLDPQGRMTIPPHFREELGQMILLRSMKTYLKARRENGGNLKHEVDVSERQTTLEIKPFQSVQEAEEYLSKGKAVVYIGYNGRKVIGRFKAGAGDFFSFVGKDENEIIVPVHQEPYWKFYPGE